MVGTEADCIFAEPSSPSMGKAAGEALSGIFFVGFKEANNGLNKGFFITSMCSLNQI